MSGRSGVTGAPRGAWASARRALAAVAAAQIVFASSALAQQTGGHAAEPGQIEKRIRAPEERPPTVEEVSPPSPAGPAAPAAPGAAFTLVGVDIQGASVYPVEALTFAYEDYLGRGIAAAEIETILGRITEKYRADGYVLSRATAPAQDAAFGILRIEVVEGFVEQVRFSGVDPDVAALLREHAGRIEAMRPLRLAGLERALLLMADTPGFKVFPALAPVDEARGVWRLDVRLEYSAFGGFANLDNRGTPAVGPVQLYAGANLNSTVAGPGRTRITLFTIPASTEELRYAELFHEHLIGADGLRLWGSVSRSLVNTDDSAAEGPDERDRSDGTRITVGLSRPFLRSRDASVTGTLTFDAIDSDKNSPDEAYRDRLRVLRLGGWTQLVDGIGGTNWLSVEFSKGLDILHANDRNDARVSRARGRSDFVKFKVDAVRRQALAERWSANLAASAQTSPHVLLSAEEFTVGGRQFGRAYEPADISGQDGAAGSLELRFDPPLETGFLKSLQLYAFYDIGAVWGSGLTRQSLASAGGGVRIGLPRNVSAELELAAPLTRPVTPGEHDDNAPQVYFNLQATF